MRKYKEFLEARQPYSLSTDNCTKQTLAHRMSPKMPDKLLEFILDWEFVQKSKNGQSWYSAPKSNDSFEDKGIRVSDHWNFKMKHDQKYIAKQMFL